MWKDSILFEKIQTSMALTLIIYLAFVGDLNRIKLRIQRQVLKEENNFMRSGRSFPFMMKGESALMQWTSMASTVGT
jgi:hypothetical protein